MGDEQSQIEQLSAEVAALKVGAEVAPELFEVANAMDASHLLRGALTEQSLSGTARAELAGQLLNDKISSGALGVLRAAVQRTWSSGVELASVLRECGVRVLFTAAEASDALEDVLAQLAQFVAAVEATPKLATTLTDDRYELAQRRGLVTQLLSGAHPITVQLACEAVGTARRGYRGAIEGYLNIAAAMRGRVRGTLTSARPISDAQLEKLGAELERIYGGAVDLELKVDPLVVGGIRVDMADEIIDGTLSARLEQARREIANPMQTKQK